MVHFSKIIILLIHRYKLYLGGLIVKLDRGKVQLFHAREQARVLNFTTLTNTEVL